MGIRLAQLVQSWSLLLAVLVMCMVTAAAAQTPAENLNRGYVNINLVSQSGNAQQFKQTLAEDIYGEEANYTLTHAFSSGGGTFDVSAGGRVWSNFAAGLAYSTFKTTNAQVLGGTVPNPLFFNRLRTLTPGTPTLTDHHQTGVHVQLSWFVPVNDKIDVAVFGGPSFFSVKHSLASSITVNTATEDGPFYDSAPDVRVYSEETSGNTTGGNVGVDVTYLFTDVIGAGFMLRWAGGSVNLTTDNGPHSIDVGGLQVGFGARVRF